MGSGEDATGRGGTLEAALLEFFAVDAALPPRVQFEWERLRFCVTLGWTFAEFDAQDVRAIARAGKLLERAARYEIKVRLA